MRSEAINSMIRTIQDWGTIETARRFILLREHSDAIDRDNGQLRAEVRALRDRASKGGDGHVPDDDRRRVEVASGGTVHPEAAPDPSAPIRPNQCEAFARAAGRRCVNRALPGGCYCRAHQVLVPTELDSPARKGVGG